MSSARLSYGLAAAVVIAALAGCGSPAAAPADMPAAQAQAAPPAQQPSTPAASTSQTGAGAPQHAIALTDAEIPPLPVTPFAPARPMEVVRAVYAFAARHPEVLSHVPCFCGCESRGHQHNDDCFVAARDARGRPTAWEPHGVG
jgi:Protein of unknown function with PCYCGC motif